MGDRVTEDSEDGRPDHGKLRDESLRGRQAGPRAGRSRKCVRRPSPEGQRDTRQDADAEGSLFRKDIVPEGRQSRKDAVPENSLQFNKKQPEFPAVSYFKAYLPFPATKMPHTLVPTAGIWVKGASRSVRKNRSRVRTAPTATRRRFYAERRQPACCPPHPQSHKRQEACLHTVCPCGRGPIQCSRSVVSMIRRMWAISMAPLACFGSPDMGINRNVGMLRTAEYRRKPFFLVHIHLIYADLPGIFSASDSITGPIIPQGPHHGA